MINRKELSIKIEQKRQILNLFANEKGLTHPDTIRFSQELEKYLLNYQLAFIKFRHNEK
ncbi:Spo0E family sporulation regulatory protein-aspartic acid phosphatase [Heyndrickxia oleronia]|uniref:Spo0E family sporulation regulatory protein-aspartic acid phosphatase n=1 Tax=Heyndrickxia oleronia TaxID=38875 RepID=UPI003753419E